MARSLKFIIPIIIIFALIVLGLYQLYKNRVNKQTEEAEMSKTPSPQAGFEVSPSPSTSPVLGANVPAMQPASGSDTVEVKNIGIYVYLPVPNQQISSPIQVQGRANVFDGNVQIRIRDANGNILGQTSATACLAADACPFETSVAFSKPTTNSGTVELYSPNPVDSSKNDLQIIQVQF